MIGTSIFLLPNGTFFVELVVVAVILFLMTKYILPPLNKAMESRQEKIRSALAAADAARAEADAADDERAQVLAQAREQARAIVAGAQETSDQLKAEAAGRAQVEYDRIVATAQSEVVAARQHAIDEASARMGEIVFDLVSKIVEREVDQSTHEDLVREAVAALNAEALKGA
ncbi:MAG TPA: F0F1 ATP synthase subunit B [Acidimicrobiales bacterium]|jgi:F-type H+-transporting ATPase subunit b|nr:F0F1 ATP synthase subunit B [Acidimicrobiales bacterium]